jgi:hypothetical protein
MVDMREYGMRNKSQAARAAAVERTREWRRRNPWRYDKQQRRYVIARKKRRAWKRALVGMHEGGIQVEGF